MSNGDLIFLILLLFLVLTSTGGNDINKVVRCRWCPYEIFELKSKYKLYNDDNASSDKNGDNKSDVMDLLEAMEFYGTNFEDVNAVVVEGGRGEGGEG